MAKPVIKEIADVSYFTNCRGSDFLPSYPSVWNKSGGIPTMFHPFAGAPESMDSNVMYFAGTTRTSLWTHFNRSDVLNQMTLLKNTGFNLLRIPLDFYCWSALGSTFLTNAQYIASKAVDLKLYIQWVLFEGDTQEDVSGIDSLGRRHQIGGKDPETLPQAISKGLHYWQRCPTVYNSQLMTRHPSSLANVGNSYLSSVIGALSSYSSTLAWEVMANVYFDSSANPADVSGYAFLTSAITKVKSLKPSRQKVTASYKYLTTIPTSPYYSLNLLKTLSSLDFVCYKASHTTEVDRNITYANAISSILISKKPIMAVDVGLPSHFNFLSDEIYEFDKLQIGWITDALIDNNYSVKSNNNSRGLIYPDGSVRNYVDASAIKNKFCKDNNIVGSAKKLQLSRIPKQKTNFEENTLAQTVYSTNFTKMSQWGDVGQNLWNDVKSYISSIPDYSGISSKYAPYDSSIYSKSNGWELANTELSFSRNNFSNFFEYIIRDILDFPLEAYQDEIERDKKAFKRINTLERLQRSLPITLSGPLYRTQYDPSFIASSTQKGILDAYQYFKPLKYGGQESIPYIGTPRYFSSLNKYESDPTKSTLYSEPLGNCQKPIGFFNNYTASGSCFYKSAVTTNKQTPQDVINKIDWAVYDDLITTWLKYILEAYEELFQMYTTLNFASGEEEESGTAIRNILGLTTPFITNTKYTTFYNNMPNLKEIANQIIAGEV